MKTFVAYVPVLHEGYRRFFTHEHGEKELYILGEDLQAEIPELAKDIRKLEPEVAQVAIAALGIFERVDILTKENISDLEGKSLVMPDDEVTTILSERFLTDSGITRSPIFLMWDKHNAAKERPIVPDERITRDEFARRMLKDAEIEAGKSSDIWRHVGAVLVKDGEPVLTTHNTHLPTEHAPYENGDPRNWFHKGDNIELSSAIHAEAGIISEAAKRGIATEGAAMYLTVFPCPPCAKLIAQSGITTLYCGGGYGVLDGEEILKNADVTILFVE